jgi:hypothetical protein
LIGPKLLPEIVQSAAGTFGDGISSKLNYRADVSANFRFVRGPDEEMFHRNFIFVIADSGELRGRAVSAVDATEMCDRPAS